MVDLNQAYVEELFFDYLKDPESVSPSWRRYFQEHQQEIQQWLEAEQRPLWLPQLQSPELKSDGEQQAAAPAEVPVEVKPQKKKAEEQVKAPPAAVRVEEEFPPVPIGPEDQLLPLRGIQSRIAENMNTSLKVPTATSVRTLPVKVLDENRQLLNAFLVRKGQSKLSFTHLIGWALIKALKKYPRLNDAFTVVDGKPYRVVRSSINLGLAVDLVRPDGSRTLVVPNVKSAEKLSFKQFVEAYNSLIRKARDNALELDSLLGTTVTLTNPGMIGTVMSIPRLMWGQGLIFATGAITYPAEYSGVTQRTLATMAVGKVMTVTSTYDHRIIQGAESGEFLQYFHRLILGEEGFYEEIFHDLGVPFRPWRWSEDRLVVSLFQDYKELSEREARVRELINAYRVRGHLYADINPLRYSFETHPELEPSSYGFTIWDLDREFNAGDLADLGRAPLRDILAVLRDRYCGTLGIEYKHMQEPEKKEWVQRRIENREGKFTFTPEEKKRILQKLIDADSLEQFLHTRFIGHKRFSLEGGESLIPLLDFLFDAASTRGLQEVYLGMAHRGRLNVMVNIIGMPAERIFREFQGDLDPESFYGAGDVKYHLGGKGVFHGQGGAVQITLAANPSHLESVNPVVEGMARARIDELQDPSGNHVLPVLIHGDAAFAGQGVVAETLNLSKVRAYHTGGTIHIIINNQIGFTTSPEEARSTVYATDLAKMLQVPILHVNGNDPEAVVAAALFALEYRQTFHEDVVIDMFCYRKYGHNEADEPSYTQPLLYKIINQMTPVWKLYSGKLQREKILDEAAIAALYKEAQQRWQKAYDQVSARKVDVHQLLQQRQTADLFQPVPTAVDAATLRLIAEKITTLPEHFTLHPKLKRFLEHRRQSVLEGKGIDWATGEALAFGSLLLEKHRIRMSGQDSVRGTFSQRHAAFVDYETGEEYIPLNHIKPGEQEQLHIYDSTLSEFAVLGFEYGYSLQNLEGLTLWEAQFGDFANGAQVVFDQYLSSGEVKWGTKTNLTVLLPHGYEGQGPEHSSARLERFLQLAAENNMIIGNFTLPSQYFHALRRQVLAPWRKPLVLMTPKSLLRHRLASSTLEEFTSGRFQEVIPDPVDPASVRRVIFCTGKVYYDLFVRRRELKAESQVALIRIEQLYPFPEAMIDQILERFARASEILWVQEEPINMGAWWYIDQKLRDKIGAHQRFWCVARPESASPATGYSVLHAMEQEELLKQAFA